MSFFKHLFRRIGLPLMLLGFIAPFGVRAQAVIFVQPLGQEAGIGTDVTFRVGARNDTPLPLRYHWRLNGEVLRGATNATLTLSNVQPANAGSYSVTVADRGGSVNSAIARLTLTLPVLPFSDDFKSKTDQIVALAGIGRGNNTDASREKGEPFHAGNHGSHSVWLTWRPLADGIANFSTAGSGFDTLLAVYTGADLTNLTQVEADDDQGGFHTSSVQFNATAGTVYHVAVDGRGRAAGEIVLLWHMEVTPELLPNITVEPLNTIGLIGDKVSLAVRLDTLTDTGVQWLFNGHEISAATSDVLDVGDLQRTKVGKYVARIRKGTREILSEPVEIQIHVRGDGTTDRNVRAGDRFNDVADLIASSAFQPQNIQPSGLQRAASAPARGYTGTQIFSTFGATKEEGEPNHCGEPGGASEWYAYQAEADGITTIDTDGSDFDTVLAVYTGPGTDFASLVEVTCDKDSGQDGKDSKATFAVKAGTVYFIAVDGVDGASGTVTLNYNLVAPPRISAIPDQTTDEDTPTGTINFTVDSANPQATNFTLTASSSNTNLVPNENIFLGASTTNHTIRIIPATNQFGTTTITVTASDGTTSASESFVVTVKAVNDAPTISDLVNDFTISIESHSARLPFTINDVETPAADLIVSAVSSDTNLVSIVDIATENGGTNRVLIIQPNPVRRCTGGVATITLTVADSDGGTINRSLIVEVTEPQRPITITRIPDQTIRRNTSTASLPFSASASCEYANLKVFASAANTNLVPNGNILIAGTGTSRTVTITPAANQTGSTVVSVTAVDESGLSASTSFALTVNPTNTPPTISPLETCGVGPMNSVSRPIPFTVSDLETPADALVITANSSNTNLVLDTGIVFGGGGTNRTVTFTPTTNNVGFTRITITVTDTDGGTASASFGVTIGLGAPAPQISPIPDRGIIANSAPLVISLAVDDCETPPDFLMVSGNSSNTALVPDANLVISGSGTNRMMTITPATNQTGSTTITVTVRDTDGNTAFTSFLLTVNPTNTQPTISLSTSFLAFALNSTGQSTPFIVFDPETPADALIITAHSSNTNLVPNTGTVFGGSGTNRTVTVTPATNNAGCSKITIIVTDTDGATGSALLIVQVGLGANAPIISPLPDRGMIMNTTALIISLAIDDCETPPDLLMVSGTSSNTALVPDANIVISGGTNRLMTITPATNQTGTTTITVTVRDTDGNTTPTSFTLTVLAEIRLNAQSILVGGAVQIRLTGFIGQGALIQSSTDLKLWQSIYTNTAPDGHLPPLDFEITAQPWQFFRALLSK